ncbi:MAG: signal peptidase I [Candidatus Omnitrophica bacterium]|nr:signal peptidase I [Candidatus Omnitrophota bacterium]
MSKKNKEKSKKKGVVREWVDSFIVAAIVATIVRTLFFQNYKIPTASMKPILTPGDRIFVTRMTYGPKIPIIQVRLPGFGKPQRGDVVVFVPPDEVPFPWYKRRQFIKRLIGLPGEKVEIKNGSIYINDKLVTDERIAKNYYYNYGEYGMADSPVVVPKDKYFFLGDNSANSQDSRKWGYADEEWVVGKALFIWWPPKRWAKIR